MSQDSKPSFQNNIDLQNTAYNLYCRLQALSWLMTSDIKDCFGKDLANGIYCLLDDASNESLKIHQQLEAQQTEGVA